MMRWMGDSVQPRRRRRSSTRGRCSSCYSGFMKMKRVVLKEWWDYEFDVIQSPIVLEMVGKNRPAVVPSSLVPQSLSTVHFACLARPHNPNLNRPICTKMEETDISNFISPMYTPSCLLMLTTPGAHVPVQAGRPPLETVERCRTRMGPDVCNHAHISSDLKTRETSPLTQQCRFPLGHPHPREEAAPMHPSYAQSCMPTTESQC